MKQILRIGEGDALFIKYFSLLAVATIMCLEAVQQVSAQVAEPAVTAIPTDSITPLQIGDTIPGYLWDMPLQVVNHPEGKHTITLNDYRGKLIILDFWGTFCSVCIKSMPAIHNVQKQFADEMAVIPVSWSKPNETEQALRDRSPLKPLNLFSVVEAKTLIGIFRHAVVPHYVWISPEGTVIATTASNDVTPENVSAVLHGEKPSYAVKEYIDMEQPLLLSAGALPKEAEIKSYSIFIRGLLPSVGATTKYRKKEGTIYGMGIFNNKIETIYTKILTKMIGAHPGKRLDASGCKDGNTMYSFDFIRPVEQKDSLYQWMLQTLNQVSGYHGQWTQRSRECLILSRYNQSAAFISQGGGQKITLNAGEIEVVNIPIERFIRRLSWEDMSGDRIVVNETGYQGTIDIHLYPPFDDFQNVKRQLNAQGLDIAVGQREVEIFEINNTTLR